ncbi:DUF167 domain-containing protein [Rhodobacteraceae bacterium 2CG4]|uniref:UPF0235 protein GE300_01910 n=2 Tax=Halovulum marinum TaxID=2662447 RepID=A0A6L5YWM4_9RHOB|nr:DUF167 domain-containing protein [Halovulum marinum]
MAAEIGALLDGTGLLQVRVSAGAGRDAVAACGDRLAVRVTAPAEGGRANAAVIRLIARALGCPKSALELVRGAAARDKVFRVRDQPPAGRRT